MRPAAVLFDCDGVIVDSEPAAFGLLRADLAAHGVHLTLDEVERDLIGGTARDCWLGARAMGADLPEDWVEDFYARLYARLAEGTPLIPGITEVLDALDAAGIAYAVGSNGRPEKMQVTLGQHPATLARFQGRLFSGQTLGRPKPDPALYLHAAEALGADPARCVVVEDSATGSRAAARAGMRCYGYAPHGHGARLEAEGAHIFGRMQDLPALLGL